MTDRERDGLIGPVRAILTDDVILEDNNGQWLEVQQASSVSVYDETGKRTLQTPFRVNLPTGYAITQHELFFDPRGKLDDGVIISQDANGKMYVKHDRRGNVIEKGREGGQGSSPQVSIKYDFDAEGNWVKRTISRLTQKTGQSVLLPAETGYRHIVYFNANVSASANDSARPLGAKQLKSPLPATDANISAGRSLFNQKCIACHGENGKAQTEFASVMSVKPADLTGQKTRAMSVGEIYSVISDGIKSSGMPAFKDRVGDNSLWQIALYVMRLSSQPAAAQTTLASASPSPSVKPVPATAAHRYQFKGKVVSINRETQEVTVEHEEIPGYMGAMTMPFPLKDEKILGKLRKDDFIQATLVVDRSGWRLEKVVIR